MAIETTYVGAAGLKSLSAYGFISPAPRAFFWSSYRWEFGDVTVIKASARAFEIKGPTKLAMDDVGIVFVDSGQILLRDEQPKSVTAGESLVVPLRYRYRISVTAESSYFLVRFPMHLLDGMLPDKPDAPIHVDHKRVLARAAHAFVRQVSAVENSATTAVEAYAVGQLLVEMAGGILLDTLADFNGEPTGDGSIRDRARAIIAQSYSDPMLSSQVVAVETQISLRRLQSAFSEANTTVSDVIQSHRVDAASAMLTSHRYNILSLEEIAHRAGFTSNVTMRRAFNRLGRPNPSDLRKGVT
ncbi:helix-turn-helix domain-containing protein [Paramicrobacterium sp. CJ85]|uniref:helix-turn-helix domain-containing protein n=1 Tax=Paramicrobacterium sp. CJ85 TaxID=3445355 RepID=UPI003F5FFD04